MIPVRRKAFNVMKNFFDYDTDIPLDDRIVELIDKPGFIREKIVFNGINNSRVQGYLGIPKKV